MKLLDVFKSANSNLFRNKGRTILTVIAIFIGAVTLSITTALNVGAQNYIDKQLESVGRDDQLIVLPNSPMISNSNKPKKYDEDKANSTKAEYLTEDDLEAIRSLDGVKEVKTIGNPSVDFIKRENGTKYIFPVSESGGIDIELKKGRQVNNDTDDFEINISPEFIKSLGFSSVKEALNKKVQISATSRATGESELVEATIVGVRTKNIMIQSGTSIMNRALTNKLSSINDDGLPENMQNQKSIAVATLKKNISDKKVENIKNKLEKRDLIAQTLEDQIGTIRQIINAVTGVLTLFAAIALLAASFGIINTLYMSVQDRTREIGLMKALGMGTGKIFLTFSFEALLIGFWGGIIGVAVGQISGNFLNEFAKGAFLEGLEGYQLLQFSPVISGGIVLLLMCIAFIAGTFPATKAAKMDPINALRHE